MKLAATLILSFAVAAVVCADDDTGKKAPKLPPAEIESMKQARLAEPEEPLAAMPIFEAEDRMGGKKGGGGWGGGWGGGFGGSKKGKGGGWGGHGGHGGWGPPQPIFIPVPVSYGQSSYGGSNYGGFGGGYGGGLGGGYGGLGGGLGGLGGGLGGIGGGYRGGY